MTSRGKRERKTCYYTHCFIFFVPSSKRYFSHATIMTVVALNAVGTTIRQMTGGIVTSKLLKLKEEIRISQSGY